LFQNEPKKDKISAKSHFFSESDWANITITPSKEKKMSLISTIYPPVNLSKNEKSVYSSANKWYKRNPFLMTATHRSKTFIIIREISTSLKSVIQKLFTGNIPQKQATPIILGGNYARSSRVI
jgi:hypothetical protein